MNKLILILPILVITLNSWELKGEEEYKETNNPGNSSIDDQINGHKPIENEFLITRYSVGKAELGMQISNLYEAFSGYSFSDVSLWEYGIHSDRTGILISKENEPLLFIWNKQDEDKIHGIFILSDKYHTKNNIKVGASIEAILKEYPDFALQIDCLDGDGEYFFIQDLKAMLIFKTNEDTRVGVYNAEDCSVKTFLFDKSKTIDLIHVIR
jgi:hypothetical protein